MSDRSEPDVLERRAAVHAALGEPIRLAIVDELLRSDRSPSELAARFDLPSNLLAHHLAVLERVGVVERTVSSGDRRRRYVRVLPQMMPALDPPAQRASGSALFVCTHNSARSQLAASLWRHHVGSPAHSAGTHPAEQVHPGAVLAGRRRGLDLADQVPRQLGPDDLRNADVVVTVCDRAHEEVDLPADALHWSVPDPVGAGDPDAFDRAADALALRISAVSQPPSTPPTVTTNS